MGLKGPFLNETGFCSSQLTITLDQCRILSSVVFLRVTSDIVTDSTIRWGLDGARNTIANLDELQDLVALGVRDISIQLSSLQGAGVQFAKLVAELVDLLLESKDLVDFVAGVETFTAHG